MMMNKRYPRIPDEILLKYDLIEMIDYYDEDVYSMLRKVYDDLMDAKKIIKTFYESQKISDEQNHG